MRSCDAFGSLDPSRGRSAGVDAELGEDVLEMPAHRARRQPEPGGDLGLVSPLATRSRISRSRGVSRGRACRSSSRAGWGCRRRRPAARRRCGPRRRTAPGSRGAARATSRSRWVSRVVISSSRARQPRARLASASMTASLDWPAGLEWGWRRRGPAWSPTGPAAARAAGRARSPAAPAPGLMVWVRVRIAVQRATRSTLTISTAPVPALGITVACPACTVRAAPSASRGSDLPLRRRAPRRGAVGAVDLHHDLATGGQQAGQRRAVAAAALDPETPRPGRARWPSRAGAGRRLGWWAAARWQAAGRAGLLRGQHGCRRGCPPRRCCAWW
jgi:hypothetical protein